MLRLLKHWGVFVFFSILSSAQTFRSGSDDRSSAMVTSKAVPSTCFMCVMGPDPGSYASKLRTSLKADERMWTRPSSVPRNRDSEPEASDLKLLPWDGFSEPASSLAGTLTSKSWGSGRDTCVTSKKLKTFHCARVSAPFAHGRRGKLQLPTSMPCCGVWDEFNIQYLQLGTGCGRQPLKP